MKSKRLIYVVLMIMILALAGTGAFYWYQNSHFVSTEDARVDGTIVKVSPQIAGQILELNCEEGQKVEEGEILGRVSDSSLPTGANFDLTVLRAPITGTIIEKIGHIGEIATAGQSTALVADLNSLYITANIEESDLAKIAVDQYVEFTIDAIPGVKFAGRVESVGEATASTFSLLPTSNTSGNFTKVVQRVPIKIMIEDYKGQRLLPGMNAIVKVHLQ